MGETMYERPRYSERERRELLRRFLRREATALREKTEDPETRRFVEKALKFLSAKEGTEARQEAQEAERRRAVQKPEPEPSHAESGQHLYSRTDYDVSGADASGGATRKTPKQFGIFWAVEGVAEFDMVDSKSGFALNKGDSYVELHLPSVAPEDRTLEKAGASLEALGEYLDENELTPKYVFGITFKKLADASRRWGFEVVDPDFLSADLRESVERFNRVAVREGLKDESMGRLLLAYQDGAVFLNRFSNRLPPGF